MSETEITKVKQCNNCNNSFKGKVNGSDYCPTCVRRGLTLPSCFSNFGDLKININKCFDMYNQLGLKSPIPLINCVIKEYVDKENN